MITDLLLSGNLTNLRLAGDLLRVLSPNEIFETLSDIRHLLIRRWYDLQKDQTKLFWQSIEYFAEFSKPYFECYSEPSRNKCRVYNIGYRIFCWHDMKGNPGFELRPTLSASDKYFTEPTEEFKETLIQILTEAELYLPDS